jgi:hypothetical protein
VWVVWCLAVLINIAFGLTPIKSYGDSAYLEAEIVKGMPYPRWLTGTAILSWVYAAIWQLPPLLKHLPAALATSGGFLSVTGALAMGIGTIALLRRWPNRLAVLLPSLLPCWVLFSAGYREYYPFIACALLAALAWLFAERLEDRSPRDVGLLVALLPLLYVGFASLSVLIFVFYVLAAPRGQAGVLEQASRSGSFPSRAVERALKTAGIALFAFVLMIVVFWPYGVSDFFRQLYTQLNFGEANTEFPRYLNQSADPTSIFFTTRYALSSEHLRDVAYMSFWGGGLFVFPLLVAAITLAWRSRRGAWREAARERRLWLGTAIFLWQLTYLLFMIPKLGPTRDVDLFFATFISVAFFAGLLFDLGFKNSADQAESARFILLSAMLGSTVVACTFLLHTGIPVLH